MIIELLNNNNNLTFCTAWEIDYSENNINKINIFLYKISKLYLFYIHETNSGINNDSYSIQVITADTPNKYYELRELLKDYLNTFPCKNIVD